MQSSDNNGYRLSENKIKGKVEQINSLIQGKTHSSLRILLKNVVKTSWPPTSVGNHWSLLRRTRAIICIFLPILCHFPPSEP